jgi:hypothetical protein
VIPVEAILALAGRLEDAPGFDAPRQRFRRFLLDHITDLDALRTLITSCQHVPGEQHHRAMRDLMVVLGRFLGFDSAFGAYQPSPDGLRDDGRWRSPAHLQVVLDVRFDQAETGGDTLWRAAAARAAVPGADRHCVLVITMPLFAASRGVVESAVASARLEIPIAIAAPGTLLALADKVAGGRVSHADVIRLLETRMPLDFVIDLLDRGEGQSPRAEAAPGGLMPPPAVEAPACWLATVAGDLDAAPEEFLRLVVGGRHIFGVPETGAPAPVARPGDAICFHIPGRGVVGHARVLALAHGHPAIRAAHRFRQLLQLEEPRLHLETPLPLDPDTQLRLRTMSSRTSRQAPTLMKITAESYATLTAADAGRSVPAAAREALRKNGT